MSNRVDGINGATRMARQRRGKQFDPDVVDSLFICEADLKSAYLEVRPAAA